MIIIDLQIGKRMVEKYINQEALKKWNKSDKM